MARQGVNCFKKPNGLPRIKQTTAILLLLTGLLASADGLADADWYAITWDNDVFVGSDNGYTAGLFYSWFDTPDREPAEIGWLANTMAWSLEQDVQANAEASANTIGLSMITPEDISLKDPPEGDLPYSGLLYFTQTHIQVFAKGYADSVSVTLGVVGEWSYAEQAQKALHKMIGSEEPMGWDTQIDNELVFRFSRARVWQSWASDSGKQDILLAADAGLGTISSYISGSIMYRYGDLLDRSFATVLLGNDRSANPVAVDSGWYWFAGATARYTPNSIFLDGNTYKSSRRIEDWEHGQLGVTMGFAYSAGDWTLTYALYGLNVLDEDDSVSDAVDEYTRFGTITFAWQAY